MRKVGAFEAKTRFSELLDQAAAGGQITITRHGQPVAVLMPAGGTLARKERNRLLAEARRLRKGVRLGGVSIKELVAEGRKY